MNTLAKISKQLGFIFITLILVSACKGIKIADIKKDPTILRVKPYKVECNSKNKLCFKVRKKDSTTWKEIEKIEGFGKYKWGHEYDIEVTTKEKTYTLKETLKDIKAPSTDKFDLTVTKATANAIKEKTSDSTIYKIYNEINVKCDPKTECDTIKERIKDKKTIKFIMSYDLDNNQLNIEKIYPLSSGKSLFKAQAKDNTQKTILKINHYKVECDAPFTSKDTNGKDKTRFLCLQIQEKNKKGKYSEWKKYVGDIKGFTYKWGYNYEIEVTKLNTSPPIKFAFKRKISEPVKVASDSLFRLTVNLTGIKTADAIKKSNKDKTIYRIYDEINFKCDPTENRGKSECDLIQSHIDQDDAFKFTMMHDKDALKTSGLPCVSARSSFKTACK